MKKTLITLAALAAASVASADVVTNTYTADGDTWFEGGVLTLDTALSFDDNWTLTLKANFDPTREAGQWGDAVLASNASNVFGNGQMIQIYQPDGNHNKRETQFTLNGSTSAITENPSICLTGATTLTIKYDVDTRIMTLTAEGSYIEKGDILVTDYTGTLASTAVADEATAITAFGSSLFVDGALEGAWTFDSITTSVGTAPVPEPTTATLSLLALAGLAARRRRK